MVRKELLFRRAYDASLLEQFWCGVESMDNFIHDRENGLEKFISLHLSNLWLVYEGLKIVAFFALSKDALMLNTDDKHTLIEEGQRHEDMPSGDEDKFWSKEKFPAIEIDYLAVCKEKREDPDEHLGKFIVNAIAQKALKDDLSATLFVTVEALDTKEYSAVQFYRKCDFKFSEVAQNRYYYAQKYGETPTTRRMFKLIIPLDD